MQPLIDLLTPLRQFAAKLGPYLLLELLLPGGTLLALLLFVHRRFKAKGVARAIPVAFPPALVGAACAGACGIPECMQRA